MPAAFEHADLDIGHDEAHGFDELPWSGCVSLPFPVVLTLWTQWDTLATSTPQCRRVSTVSRPTLAPYATRMAAAPELRSGAKFKPEHKAVVQDDTPAGIVSGTVRSLVRPARDAAGHFA